MLFLRFSFISYLIFGKINWFHEMLIHVSFCSGHLQKNTPAWEITSILASLQARFPGVYIHPKPLAFSDGQQSANWSAYLCDINFCHTYSHLWNFPKNGSGTWVALFTTPVKSWVGHCQSQWVKDEWHAWGAAIIKSGAQTGKHIIIWDCDPIRWITSTTCASSVLLHAQLDFIRQAKNHYKVEAIWYNQDLSFGGRDLCLQASVDWVNTVASFGDKPFGGANDPRFHSCCMLWYM